MATKLSIVTLGCPKNQVDSEIMAGILAKGYELTDKPEEAEIIVVNTCTFIDPAKEESIETLLQMARQKEEGVCQTLIAAGCMAERYGQELMREVPELDGVIGTGGVAHIAEVVAKAQEEKVNTVGQVSLDFLYDENMPRIRSTPEYSAYVKVAEGCDNHCSYCVIPQVRGHFRSRPEESILEEVRQMAREGVKEILLIAQDTTRYGLDRYGELRLSRLIRELTQVEGIEWIRLMYCYPELMGDALIQTMVEEPKVCRYVDLPLQHASPRILKDMNRRGTAEAAQHLIRKLRVAMPDIRIRTSMIVGFPGETEAEFQELLDFIETVELDRLGVFVYSQEENTPAAKRRDQVPEDIREARRDRAMALQQAVSARRQKRWLGRILTVLLEEALPDGRWLGRSEGDAPEIDGQVYVEPGEMPMHPGDFVQVLIRDADSYDLIGEVVL
ncbi:MAG: 30S ribosomal protein S12 methylthiotransferase RimO [Desulfitobacteriaceae bacterium]|nr:30S ribosomal protein S12 methylthiotransferase RimO [Desulfitobacteriaceae bacterium]MDI6879444.1 30S ribosomal protein S12 methylthiotransferase RimO [Desulfitobacteriaceae bacterium]MDI6915031.1 30S ribosomal protein S12 methylthiotransferase RimO [Desulfitobacteriaceae bacterium]